MSDPNGAEERSVLAQETIYASLGVLAAGLRADLCAYLIREPGHGPQLFLGSPALGSIEAGEAFTLFSALRDALDDPTVPVEARLAGYRAAVARTANNAGDGLLVVGRKGESLTDEERIAVEGFAPVLARLLDRSAPETTARRAAVVRLAVDSAEASCTASVSVDLAEQIRHGSAFDASPLRAVALATLDALGADGWKLVEVAEGSVAGERAVLVLVDAEERRLLGSCLVGEAGDTLHAAARAAAALTDEHDINP